MGRRAPWWLLGLGGFAALGCGSSAPPPEPRPGPGVSVVLHGIEGREYRGAALVFSFAARRLTLDEPAAVLRAEGEVRARIEPEVIEEQVP